MLDPLGLSPELLPQGVRDAIELLLGHGPPFDEGDGGDPRLVEGKGEALFLGLLLQLVGQRLARLLHVLHHLLDAVGVVVAIEHAGDLPATGIGEVLHIAGQLPHHAAWQAEGDRLGGVLKVVDVSPVRRHGLRRRYLLHMRSQRRVAPGPRHTRYEEVEPGGIDVQRQLQSAYGPWLPYSTHQGLYLVGGLELQVVGPGGSCCAASLTWRPSGPCWSQPSICAPSGGCGAPPTSPALDLAIRSLIPRPERGDIATTAHSAGSIRSLRQSEPVYKYPSETGSLYISSQALPSYVFLTACWLRSTTPRRKILFGRLDLIPQRSVRSFEHVSISVLCARRHLGEYSVCP